MLPILLMASLADEPAFLRSPDIHGDQVVFTCEGDLWLGTISTGQAVRLTRHAGVEENAKFSPDGKFIAFSAEYDGVQEAYVIPVEGGTPKRLTYRSDYAMVQDWSPDGKSILIRGRSLPRSFGLYVIPVAGGPESKLPIEFSAWADWAGPDKVVFTRFNRAGDAWFHYKGGMQNQIWTGDLTAKKFRQVTQVQGTNEYPVAVGEQIVFVNENDGAFQLMALPYLGGKPKGVGAPSEVEIRELGEGTGKVVYEKGRGIEMADLASNKTVPLKFSLLSDKQHTLPYLADPGKHASFYSMSPSGKRVLIEARGQIIDAPAGEGEARLWKSEPGARLRIPRMSPDGKLVAYVSDKGGEQQLYVSDKTGAKEKQLTKDARRQLVSFSWSPDSKWIALFDSEMRFRLINVETGEDRLVKKEQQTWSMTPYDFSPDSQWIVMVSQEGVSYHSSIAFYSIKTKETTVVKHPLAYDTSPAFSSDGKKVVFISRRNFRVSWDGMLSQMNTGPNSQLCMMLLTKEEKNPLALTDQVEAIGEDKKPEPPKPAGSEAPKPEDKSVKIDFDGLYGRTFVLPLPPDSYSQVDLIGSRLLFAASGTISAMDLKAKAPTPITQGGGYELSADKTKMLIGNRVVDVSSAGVPPTAGAVSTGGLMLEVDPRQEWKQIYWDAWRLLRDYFYVANMHGVDWPRIGAKYAIYLDSIRSRDELDILIRWMQAELNSSHQYLSPGDERTLAPKQAGGFLGIDTEPSDGKLRIKTIFRGDGLRPEEMSPLAAPGLGIKDGDYILSIGGRPVTANSDYRERLVGRVGQIVSITFSSKSDGSDPKTIFVKPIANETRIRRLEWVEANRRYVEKASNGRIGYLYLGAMSSEDMSDFIKQFYPQRNKEAMVIDTRFNNGGNVQSMINRILAEPLTGFFNMRASETSWSRQGDYFLGPMVCLQNEFNVSCGEEFPHRFRDLKLGPVIGRRTYGGEVGSSPGWPLVDGGVVSVPNYGMWTPDGKWVIEGPGVEPDIDVPSDPNAFVLGKDPQLDKCVEWLLNDLRKNPVKKPVQPADPVRVKKP